jgi:nicotinamidase/pyrazinamidase
MLRLARAPQIPNNENKLIFTGGNRTFTGEESIMKDITRRDSLKFIGGAGLFAAFGTAAWSTHAAGKITPDASSALIVVDVQNCFIPGGTLPVNKGDEVVQVINRISGAFRNVVLTQDWHTPGHASFASAHGGKKPFETTKLSYGQQVLWPDHCVQGTADADLHKDLKIPHAQLVIRKGFRKGIDSYSAFMEADRKTTTGLSGYLKERKIKKVFVTGLATDFCVAWTAMDARKEGFETYVIEDACRGIDLNGSLERAWSQMKSKGVKRIQSGDITMA